NDSLRSAKVVALNPQSLANILDDIGAVGRAAGCANAAVDYIGRLQARVTAVRMKTSWPRESPPRVACVEWIEPLMLSGNWIPQLIQFAGGQNGVTVAGQPSRYASWKD